MLGSRAVGVNLACTLALCLSLSVTDSDIIGLGCGLIGEVFLSSTGDYTVRQS